MKWTRVAELTAEEREDVGDEVIALDLFVGYAELRCDRVTFVRIHDQPPAQSSARRREVSRRCSVASWRKRFESARA